MRGFDQLQRELETIEPDTVRARRIENLTDDLASARRWLEQRLTESRAGADDDGLWIDCAHKFSELARLALRDLSECHGELVRTRRLAELDGSGKR